MLRLIILFAPTPLSTIPPLLGTLAINVLARLVLLTYLLFLILTLTRATKPFVRLPCGFIDPIAFEIEERMHVETKFVGLVTIRLVPMILFVPIIGAVGVLRRRVIETKIPDGRGSSLTG